MKLFTLFLLGAFMTNVTSVSSSELPLTEFLEVSLPAEDLESSTKFYKLFGYSLLSKEPWGMVSLKKGKNNRVTLYSNKFFKKIAISFTTKDLNLFKKFLVKNGIQIIEDDSTGTPPRIVISDPTGIEVMIFQQ